MEMKSALYQLMDIRMNGVMNDITNNDREYQEIIRKCFAPQVPLIPGYPPCCRDR